ncbi:MAG TPA: chemotaxis protein CheB, partial [Candidatus Methanofastidiosum sp.]|nr:chemotaxis protein CheB [Methanofastidiosum sp.]
MKDQKKLKITNEIEKAKLKPKSNTTKTKKEFNVVGIGASAGGLEAFEKFFLNMSPDSGSAFVLVPHLDPKHVSIMPELIQKYTKMKVNIVKKGMKIEQNSVYVVPANMRIYVQNRALKLIELSEYHEDRLPIDFFFISLAEDVKEKAIGIVLSGTGNDGTIGLKKIKEKMGITIAQDPSSAKYDGMPRSAINSNVVDYVLPVEKMPEKIIAFEKRLFIKILEKDETEEDVLGHYENI